MYVNIHTYIYIWFTFITFKVFPPKILFSFVLFVFETGSFYIILTFLKLTI